MLLKPIRNTNHAKWRAANSKYSISLEYRPLLDKWDVVSIPGKLINTYNWYMYRKTDRFDGMKEALVFILKRFSDGEIQVEDRYSKEITIYNQKEFDMLNKAVANITLVYGKDSRLIEDTEIFGHIKKLEDEIKKLNSIENKPKKLSKKIDELNGDIKELVAVVDGR